VLASGCEAGQLDCAELDLASLASVRQFASTWNKKGQPVDALLNNAGVMAVRVHLRLERLAVRVVRVL